MPQITRKLEFDAGHRVLGHENKCAHLHGHRYVAEIAVSAFGLDDLSRVVDFSVIKTLVGSWVDEHWDHNLLLNTNDPLLKMWEDLYSSPTAINRGLHEWRAQVFALKEPYVMPGDLNPTAEVMAQVLFEKARELLTTHHITVEHVRLYETPNCWADYGGAD